MNKYIRIINIFIFSLLLIVLDQFVKYEIRTRGGFYICNHNLAFSLSPLIFSLVLASLIVILLIYNFKSILNFKFQISNFTLLEIFSGLLILSGAISNVIDRLHFGCVIDFIDLQVWPASIAMRSIAGWPVFNFADIYITIGAMLILTEFLFEKRAL